MVIVLNTSATLNEGDRGDAVKGLQQALLAIGHDPGAPDGVYGSGTRKAVRAFQAKVGIQEDGIAGRRTQAALVESLAQLEAEQRAQIAQAVATAQNELLAWMAESSSAAGEPMMLQQWLAEGQSRITQAFGQIEIAIESTRNPVG